MGMACRYRERMQGARGLAMHVAWRYLRGQAPCGLCSDFGWHLPGHAHAHARRYFEHRTFLTAA